MKVPTSIIRGNDPVSEETEAGVAVASVISDELTDHLDSKYRALTLIGSTTVISLGVGAYLVSRGLRDAAIIAFMFGLVAIGIGVYLYRQPPDVQVKRAEKRFWTAHIFPQSDGILLFDGTESVPDTKFELESVPNQDALREISEELQRSWELPVVLPREQNVEVAIQDDLTQLESVLSNTKQTTVHVPTVSPDSTLVDAVETVAPYADEGLRNVDSIETSFDEAQDAANEIENLETLAFEDDVEETFSEITEQSSQTIEQLTDAHEKMVGLLNDSIQSVGDALTMMSYNFYCPTCLDDEIYTALELRTDDSELEWYCGTCQDVHEGDCSVPKNRIKDDLVDEIWDRLWIEKDDEKRGIYEEIEDQQADLKEREFEQKQEIIRDGWNRIKDIRSKIRDLETDAAAGKGAVEEIGNVLVKYDRVREDRKAEFHEDVARAVERVDEETAQVLAETRDFEQDQTEAAEKEAEQRAEIRREEEHRRHREQLAASDGGLGIGGTISSMIHTQKVKMKRRRINATSATDDWGDPDRRDELVVETGRPVAAESGTASLRARTTGVIKADQVTAYFEWRPTHVDHGGLRNRDSWAATEKQTLTAPGPFTGELPDVDPNSKYKIRAIAEVNGERYTGDTLIFPDDATTTARSDVEELTAEVPNAQRSEQP